MFGNPTPLQWHVFSDIVPKTEQVLDLGCGDMELSCRIAARGYNVVGYDYAGKATGKLHKRAKFVPRSFKQVLLNGFDTPTHHTMLISWPDNYPEEPEALNMLLSLATMVVYLGKNTDGTVCGSPSLFTGLLSRQVLAYLPSPENTMIIYGPNPRGIPRVYPEEFAGLTVSGSRPPLLYRNIEGTTTHEASSDSAGR